MNENNKKQTGSIAWENGSWNTEKVFSRRFGEAEGFDVFNKSKKEGVEECFELQLNHGHSALISASDHDICCDSKWMTTPNGYVLRKPDNRFLHNVLMGEPHDGLCVDHINRNRFDCRRSNLRWVTRFQNASNASKRNQKEAKTSQYKGVHWCKSRNQWIAQIQYLKKKILIGAFDSEALAASEYDKAAVRLFGEYSSLNFTSPKSMDFVIVGTIIRIKFVPCCICGKPIKQNRRDNKYCGNKCANTYHDNIRKLKRKEADIHCWS
jgi:predicted nucleic acid-binding Zn ribbon protein